MVDVRPPVAVVCHDAGAANLLLHWLAQRPDLDLQFSVDGPAEAIARRLFPQFVNLRLADALAGAVTLLSGTSWGSDLEREARSIARDRAIPSVAVVDHWVNYRERFLHRNTPTLPDEVWVFDAHAETEARRCFAGQPVVLQRNWYMEAQVAEIAALRTEVETSDGERILYVLEPIRAAWAGDDAPGEFQALDYFMERLAELDGAERPGRCIRLRPHPSEPAGKYDSWIRERRAEGSKRAEVQLDQARTLAESIAWADWVVGCESYALVVALFAGRRVVSSLPPRAPALRLPFPEILQLRDVERR